MASGNKKNSNESRVAETVKRLGPGRPLGSRNIDYDKRVVLPLKCQKCQSTEFGRRRRISSRKINGTVDGHEYNCVSHYKTRCANPKCGQAVVLIEYRMITPESEESGFDQPCDADADTSADDAFNLDVLFDAEESHE